MTSLVPIIHHCTPHSNLLMNLYPGETDIVKFIIIPFRFPFKIFPLAISVSKKILSNDFMSTGLVEILYSSYNIVPGNPRRFLILSLNTKLIIGPCGDVYLILPNVLKFGFIVNGYSVSL